MIITDFLRQPIAVGIYKKGGNRAMLRKGIIRAMPRVENVAWIQGEAKKKFVLFIYNLKYNNNKKQWLIIK